MDLQKIGAYIAQKRKELGMTQTELADKLGMSNKSVSKWERGVCLPDVSLYMELCRILGITINEFIAGEDLQEETFVEKSEENLINVTTDGEQRRRRLEVFVSILSVVVMVLSIVTLVLHMPRQNYIQPLSQNSTEMMAAELIANHGDVHMYRFSADRSYKEMSVGMVTYRHGEKVDEEEFFTYPFDKEKRKGIIAITTDFNDYRGRIAVNQGGSTGSVEFPLLEDVKQKDLYSRGSSTTYEKERIRKGEEKAICCIVYDKVGEMEIHAADAVFNGETLDENDYMYCFTVKFE